MGKAILTSEGLVIGGARSVAYLALVLSSDVCSILAAERRATCFKSHLSALSMVAASAGKGAMALEDDEDAPVVDVVGKSGTAVALILPVLYP